MNFCDKINNFILTKTCTCDSMSLPEKNATLEILLELASQSTDDEQYISEINQLIKSGASFMSDDGYMQPDDIYGVADVPWKCHCLIYPTISPNIRVKKKNKYHMVKYIFGRDVTNIKILFKYDYLLYISHEYLQTIEHFENHYNNRLIKKYLMVIDMLKRQLIPEIIFLIMKFEINETSNVSDDDFTSINIDIDINESKSKRIKITAVAQ